VEPTLDPKHWRLDRVFPMSLNLNFGGSPPKELGALKQPERSPILAGKLCFFQTFHEVGRAEPLLELNKCAPCQNVSAQDIIALKPAVERTLSLILKFPHRLLSVGLVAG
jgi:hypothetical protein